MKKSLIVAAGIALAASTGAAFAKSPVKMTDKQMDNVTAGGLVDVGILVNNVLNNNQVQVAVPVNAAVGVAVLGQATTVAAQQSPVSQITH